MNETKFRSMVYHRVVGKSQGMKKLNSLRLQSRHAWRYPESESSRTKLRTNPMSFTKLFQTFLLTLCWTLRTTAGQVTAIPLSDGDIQQIVDAHNLFRSMVEPPASNMQRVEWNSELAMVAQNYAETCMFNPNPDRAAQAPSFDTVGENRAFGRTTNYTDLIERGWFVVQRSNFDFNSNMCLSPGACDEYIQLVWAESNLVGCGAANCEDIIDLPILTDAVVFVCNYAPEGNIPGRLPYEAGPACSQCPQGMDFCVENSCSSVGTLPPPLTTTTTQAPQPPTTTLQPTTQPDIVDTTTTLSQATTTTSTELTTTTEEPQPDTTPPTQPTTAAATTSEPTPETTVVAVRTTTPTPPCPPTVSPPIIVTIKPPWPTKKPVTTTTTKPNLIDWYNLIWLIIKHKQTSYTMWPWPTPKPDTTGRTRSKSRGSNSRSSRTSKTSDSTSEDSSNSEESSKSEDSSSSKSSKSSKGKRRSKSKCTKSRSNKRRKTKKIKTRRMRGRG